MKKQLLIIITTIVGLQLYSQVEMKNIENVPMSSPNIINDISNPSAMGGDDVLWSEDFSDSTTPNITTADIAGYGDWHWGDESPGGMWSENAGIIDSETADNGFMIMEADFYNSHPQNDIIIDEVGE